jgi:hypothetical protein
MSSEIRLYGITGLYEQDKQGNFCFGGYFKHDSGTGQIFDGQLIDHHGSSKINGRMSEQELVFRKSYLGHKIDYEFRLGNNGLWLGEWKWPRRKRQGKAGCIVSRCGFDSGGLAEALLRQGTMAINVDAWARFIRDADGQKMRVE